MGIIAAYVRWLTSGQGTRVESSLFNAGVDIQMEALTKYLAKSPGRRIYKRDHHVGSWYHDAPYGVYKLRDRVVALSMNDPVKLARALGSERLHAIAGIDRYAERDRYARTVAEELKDRNYADTAKAFDAEGVWYEPVLDYDDLRDDPQAAHNQVFATIPVKNTTATVINHPLRYDGEVPPIRRLPPEIGEHSREILGELGYAVTDIDRLFRDAVVFGPVRA
jgi:crotonobetainyl-CoA:carnitine CoA-transferase CaiB-like acyl-CoA transferase